MRSAGTNPGDIVDEIPRISYLCTNIAELGKDAEEERVLLGKGLVFEVSIRGGLLRLVLHVCVCDLGETDKEENNGEEEDEDCDAKVDPLN